MLAQRVPVLISAHSQIASLAFDRADAAAVCVCRNTDKKTGNFLFLHQACV
jgi:hypothetical protein